MGNELMTARERGLANNPDQRAATNAAATPGKRTLTEALPPGFDLEALVRSLAGTVLEDHDYVWLILPEPAFVLRSAPDGKGVGTVYRHGDLLWPKLVSLAIAAAAARPRIEAVKPAADPALAAPTAASATSAPSPRELAARGPDVAPDPDPEVDGPAGDRSKLGPRPAPAIEPAVPPPPPALDGPADDVTETGATPRGPLPGISFTEGSARDFARDNPTFESPFKRGANGNLLKNKRGEPLKEWTTPAAALAAIAPLAKHDLARCHRQAFILDAGAHTEFAVPAGTFVRVLGLKTIGAHRLARIERLANIADAEGTELGWTSAEALTKVPHVARPSTPSQQMSGLVDAARGRANSTNTGQCYHFIKDAIVLAGGYGDILDINQDPRFAGFLGKAVDFAAAVRALGAANFGLVELGGTMASAPIGALAITRGRYDGAGISPTDGDIAVIAEQTAHTTFAINDARTPFTTDAAVWASTGRFELVALYMPISRK